MAFFKKTYTSIDFNRLRQKRNYSRLAKLLRHKDISVASMAEEALQELINSKDETKYRTELYETFPVLYDKIIKRLEAAQLSNHNLNIEPIVRVFVQDSEPLRTRKQVEQQEFEDLSNLLKQKGVTNFCDKNVKDLKALLGPNESIECASEEGSSGTLIDRRSFFLYTNKHIYFLLGLANHEDWGTISQKRYNAIYDIKEKGILTKQCEICGWGDDVFPLIVGRDHLLIKQLGKYGTERIKKTMRQLGVLEEESISQ